MQIKNLFTDDSAVSPVIGVILMVAITVILAAVIGAFVLNLGATQASAPQAKWDVQNKSPTKTAGSANCGLGSPGTNQAYILFSHEGGDKADATTLNLKGNGASTTWDACGGDTPVDAGASVSVGVPNGTSVDLVWESPDSGKTQILASYDG